MTETIVELDERQGIPCDWWDQFKPPPGYRAQIIQGEVIVSPSPGKVHATTTARLKGPLEADVPDGYLVGSLELRQERHGRVVRASTLDLVVASASAEENRLLLGVAVLSRSDLTIFGDGTRIEAKRADYAALGLQHYLEVLLQDHGGPLISRYALRDGTRPTLTERERVMGDQVLRSQVPYPYELRPSAL